MMIGLYRVSDLILGIVANPFFLDVGFELTEIASTTQVFGIGVTIFGAFIGGLAVAKYEIGRPLILGSILLVSTNLFYIFLIGSGPDIRYLILTISADNFALGFSGSVFIAFLSSLTSRKYTATQYALFSSLMTLPGKAISGFSGQFIETVGWYNFFLYAALAGVPAIIFTFIVVKKGWQEQ
jgi:PAT family beta-lactamase induction signal transducer AmpG